MELTTFWRRVVGGLALVLAGFHFYTATWGVLSPLLQRSLHLFGLLIVCLAAPPAGKSLPRKQDWPLLLLALGLATFFLASISPEQTLERGISGPTSLEVWAGALILLLILEATRRELGLPITIVAGLALAYGYLGPYLPSFLAHKGYDTERLVSYLVWSTEGVFGLPLMVSAGFVIVFILLGALMNRLGGGDVFVRLALAATGRHASGPAQAAVVSSALVGSISGSAVSNVVTTGTFTIPLMVKTGYSPLFAGAVEAVASTGGQLMPPVMGATAFIMAEMLGVSYAKVALAAAVPSLLYYLSLGMMVHLHAQRLGLARQVPTRQTPSLGATLRQGAFLLPSLVILIYLLVVLQVSPGRAGAFATLALVVSCGAQSLWGGRSVPWREMLGALISGVRVAAPVALACASAGIVIGVVSLTGLGVRFTQLVLDFSGGNLWLAALLTMLACLILGTGLPTTAAYVITAVLASPALIKLGVYPLAAHLFILYFAIISFITPPVAISAYAAAGISGASAVRTGLMAFRLGLAGFLVPFYFLLSPALLLEGPFWTGVVQLGSATLAVTALAAGLEGWLRYRLPWWQRGLLLLGAVLLCTPGWWRLAGGAPLALLWLIRHPHGLAKPCPRDGGSA